MYIFILLRKYSIIDNYYYYNYFSFFVKFFLKVFEFMLFVNGMLIYTCSIYIVL